MQQAIVQTSGLVARLWLATFFMSHVIEHIWPGALGSFGAPVETGSRVLDSAASVFFGLVAVWLLLGICSRIVGIIGMIVCGAASLLYSEPALPPELAVAILAMVVLCFAGGGRLRLDPDGW